MNLTLTPAGKTVLFVGLGAFLGLAVGALLVNPDAAVPLAPLWLVAGGIFSASVLVFMREKGTPTGAAVAAPVTQAQRPAAPKPLPVSRDAGLSVFVDLPDIPEGFPSVVGERESLRISVSVQTPAGAATGAAVRLSLAPRDGARTLVGEGVAGADGTILFQIQTPGVGEIVIEAEARRDMASGSSFATASVVKYEEEIARLFGEFRAFAIGTLGSDAEASTARELAERLRIGADAATSRALLEIARIYELVAYGEREADRRLYVALMQQLLVLEHADLSAAPVDARLAGV